MLGLLMFIILVTWRISWLYIYTLLPWPAGGRSKLNTKCDKHVFIGKHQPRFVVILMAERQSNNHTGYLLLALGGFLVHLLLVSLPQPLSYHGRLWNITSTLTFAQIRLVVHHDHHDYTIAINSYSPFATVNHQEQRKPIIICNYKFSWSASSSPII